MKTLILIRDTLASSHTMGQLLTPGGLRLHVLERPWRDNRPNQSCIPADTYTVDYLHRSGSGKYRQVYWVRSVPGRSGILFHAGNRVEHTLGCLLPGMRRASLGGRPAVLDSQRAMRKLRAEIGRESFRLMIYEVPQ